MGNRVFQGQSLISLFLLFLLVFLGATYSTCNDQPVIGVLSQALDYAPYPSTANYIAASYVKFLEMTGSRVVPIAPNMPRVYYEFLFSRLNGVVFPGGGVDLVKSGYHKSAKAFYEMALEAYDESKDWFPILGICMGLEELATLTASDADVMSKTDSDTYLSNLTFVNNGSNAGIFEDANDWLIDALEQQSILANYHHFSLVPSTYENNQALYDTYKVLAVSYDRNGVEFVQVMQGRKYPLFALQYHPEKNIFEWDPDQVLAHNLTGVASGQYVATYFAQQARRSCHRFESAALLNKFLIYHYCPLYTRYNNLSFSFTQMYVWNETTPIYTGDGLFKGGKN